MKRINRLPIIIAAFFFILSIPGSGEQLIRPVDTKNTLILYNSHLFMPAEGSDVISAGDNDITVNIIESNTIFDMYHFSEHGKQGIFDLETTAVYTGYTRKINDRTEIKTVVPFFYHHGGFMDKSIENFHNIFPGGGLRNGGREYVNDDEIHIQYQTANGGPDINEPFYGVGDPSFFLKRIIYDGNPGITIVAGFKPDTGHRAFINSNTTDAGINFNTDYTVGYFYFYFMAGYSYFLGDGIYSEEMEQTRKYLLSSAAGIGVMLLSSVYFSIQFYVHNSLYDTGIEKIDNVTVINSYSLRWQLNNSLLLQLAFDEDAVTYAGTDIALSLKCEYTF